MTLAITDIDNAVDSAFKDLKCDSRKSTPHGGDVFAWYDQHGCASGFICHEHYQLWINKTLPRNHRLAEDDGTVLCFDCRKRIPENEYMKVVVL